MKIRDHDLALEPLVIAEIGNNHEGRMEIACELVRQAAACGVKAVKFQTFRTEFYVSQADAARFKRLKSFELSFQQFEQLAMLARSLGLLFISTPFDLESAKFFRSIVDAFKIASGDNNFYPLIAEVAASGKPLIISGGLVDGAHLRRVIEFATEHWPKDCEFKLALLHCVSSYPTPANQANLRSISYLTQQFNLPVGYSDHTLGLDAACAAVALGARIIEKHFTLSKSFSDFRDHQLSADPSEMRELVQKVKLVSSMLGEYGKGIQVCESSSIHAMRRSIVSSKKLKRGHQLEWSDLTWIRPAIGIPPGQEQRFLGRRLVQDVGFGQPLRESDVE